jgi:hypothetical protein
VTIALSWREKIGADCRALLIRINSRDSRARNSCQFVIFDRSKKTSKKTKKKLASPWLVH